MQTFLLIDHTHQPQPKYLQILQTFSDFAFPYFDIPIFVQLVFKS